MTSTQHRTRPGLVRIARNCWLDQDAAAQLTARCAGAIEDSPDALIASVTGARVHRLWLPQLPDSLHVATATPGLPGRAMTRTRRPEIVAHRLQLSAADITTVDGIPVTTPARTWRDLAAVLDLPDLVAAGDSVLRLGVSLDELRDVMDRCSRARFAARARAALPLLDARSRSRPESHLRVAISRPYLPRFAVNEPVHRREGGWLAEPDLSLEEARLALEYQGEDHASLGRMRADITRERDMRADGWLCLLYGPAEVFGRPWTIAPEVCAVLKERAPHLVGKRGRRRS